MSTRLAPRLPHNRYGLAVVSGACRIAGLLAVAAQLWLTGTLARLGQSTTVMVTVHLWYMILAAMVGATGAAALQPRALGWYLAGRLPTPVEAERALRLPTTLACWGASLWLPGLGLEAALFSVLHPGANCSLRRCSCLAAELPLDASPTFSLTGHCWQRCRRSPMSCGQEV